MYTTRKNKLLSDLKNAEIEYFSIELEMNKSDISKCWNALMKKPGFCDIRNSCYVFVSDLIHSYSASPAFKNIIGRNCKAKQRKVTFITVIGNNFNATC